MGAPRVTVGCDGKARRADGLCAHVLGVIERNDEGAWVWTPKARKVARRVSDRQVSPDGSAAREWIDSEIQPVRVVDADGVLVLGVCPDHGITTIEQDQMLEWIRLAVARGRRLNVRAEGAIPW